MEWGHFWIPFLDTVVNLYLSMKNSLLGWIKENSVSKEKSCPFAILDEKNMNEVIRFPSWIKRKSEKPIKLTFYQFSLSLWVEPIYIVFILKLHIPNDFLQIIMWVPSDYYGKKWDKEWKRKRLNEENCLLCGRILDLLFWCWTLNMALAI